MHGQTPSCSNLSESERIATLFLRKQMLAVPAPPPPAGGLHWLQTQASGEIEIIPFDKSTPIAKAEPGVLLCQGEPGCAQLANQGGAGADLIVIVLPADPSMEACLHQPSAACEALGAQRKILWHGILGAAVRPDDPRWLVSIVDPSGAAGSKLDLGPYSLNFSFGEFAETHPVRICIASNNIAGWVRNGVGTLHRALAEYLAARGNEVTVFYTGHHRQAAEQLAIIHEYRALNIRVAMLERGDYGRERTPDVERSVEVYRWLKDRDGEFDVIVFSECQAHGFHSLAAKRAGIAFAGTLLVVSPHGSLRWCREGMQSPLTGIQDLSLNAAEERMTQWADAVVSPTQHMLGWIQSSGWPVSQQHFVHQTVLPVETLELARLATVGQQWPAPGGRDAALSEVVFFGRLETRKGLHLFVNAISLLHAQSRWPQHVSVTFLGEPGSIDGLNSGEYLEKRCAGWSCRWQIIDHLHQREALDYLRQPGRLVVIPSIQDNLPNTVFECLALDIPLLTTWVGGIPEMIAADDLPHCVCALDEDGRSLAQKLGQILADGRVNPARFACDPVKNAEAIHRWLGRVKTSASGRIPLRTIAALPVALDAVILGDNAALCAQTLASLQKMLPAAASILFWPNEGELCFGFGANFDPAKSKEAFSIRIALDQHGMTSDSRPCVLIQGGVVLDSQFSSMMDSLCAGSLDKPVSLQVLAETRAEWPHKHGWLPAGCVPLGVEPLLTTLGNHCGKIVFVPASLRSHLTWSCPHVEGSLFDRVIAGMIPFLRQVLPVAELVGKLSDEAIAAELTRTRGLHFGWLQHLRHFASQHSHPVSTLAAWSRIMQESIFIRDRQIAEAKAEAKQNRSGEQAALKLVEQGAQLLSRGLGFRWLLPGWRKRAKGWLQASKSAAKKQPATGSDDSEPS